jgi:Mg2+/Co2+ transporter CorB
MLISWTMLLTVAAVLALLVASAFFSGSETAITAASRARMHQLEQLGSRPARRVNALMRGRERLIGAILLGNNLVNILASALATSLFIGLFGTAGVVWAVLVMTALVVIFAEVLPKTYAISHPDRSALAVAPILGPVVDVLTPLAIAIERIVGATLRLVGANADGSSTARQAREELRGQISLHHLEGAVVKHDRDMLRGILDLRELEVSDVMVHRTSMKMIDAGESPDKIVADVLASGHTRLPVWRDRPDNIVGMLHAKDLLNELSQAGGETAKIDVARLTTKPWFVPDTTALTDQLNAFLRRKAHVAIVVDEYGEVMGLVALEDILEVIVGDITDEHDADIEGLRRQPGGGVTVDGWVPIRDINRAMDWRLPDETATTIAGLVIHEAQTIPEVGQVFTFHGFRFEILRRQRNRITTLRITPVPRSDAGAAA